jgi:TRAP-type C4-dicarboxylate transport system substrate-binding protein
LCSLICLLSSGVCLSAQPITWELVNEYPATTLPGEADAFFAETVRSKTSGRLVVHPIPDAKSGLRSRDQLKAVAEGRFAMADTLSGALGDESAAFLLSALPFITPSAAQARELYETARPLYEKLFAERVQKLLYVSPWPPSGLWSAAPMTDADGLRGLRIRTYDSIGTEVFAQIAAVAGVIPYADLDQALESGKINAVLSSGDGGAGRKFWRYLRNFSAINYATPLSFASVSLIAWLALDDAMRAAVEQAAQETTERQWQSMAERVTRNYAVMRENAVAIDERPPADVSLALTVAGSKSLIAWIGRAGPEAARVLHNYQARSAR